MHKSLIVALIFVSVSVFVSAADSYEQTYSLISLIENQNNYDFQSVDSLCYKYYLAGNWNELLKTGKDAIREGIDYKRLRQRMGYAYFMKADYYSAMAEYEAALNFDKSDIYTRIYLYYCGINTGNDSYARYQLAKLPVETQKFIDPKSFKIVDAIDVEYNYKSNNNKLRSNPNYWRIGCSTKLSYQLNLYQAFSTYSQTIDSTYTNNVSLDSYLFRSRIKQDEYYIHLNWKPLEHVDFLLAYHYINTRSTDSLYYKIKLLPEYKELFNDGVSNGNIFLGRIAFKYNRFDFGLSASLLTYNKILTQQYTLQAGFTLPGSLGIQLKSKVDAIFDNEIPRYIFSQNIGFIPLKNVWLEANVTNGILKNYADYNGLYILNSKDPTIFKTGATIFWQALKKISIYGNYGYDIKQLKDENNTNTNYNQHSFSGGIIWKI
ncbi:MAG: hypothetical protein WCK78_10615 [Paludibacter sp.]